MRLSVYFHLALWFATASAAPSVGLQRRSIFRRAADVQSHPPIPTQRWGDNAKSNSKVVYSSNWVGPQLYAASGTKLVSAHGTFTVPSPKYVSWIPGSPQSAAVWIGIDGGDGTNSLLQAGITMSVTSTGQVSYGAVYEWVPGPSVFFTDFKPKGGDVILIDIVGNSPTTGTITLHNQSTRQTVSRSLVASSGSYLEFETAEWIVEDYFVGSG